MEIGMKEALKCFGENYAKFDGRTSRKEYFFLQLVVFTFFALVGFLLEIPQIKGTFLEVIIVVPGFYFLIPSLSVTVRRFHDFGRSGWWILTGGIPLIGLITSCFLFFKKGGKGKNRYGENPIELKKGIA